MRRSCASPFSGVTTAPATRQVSSPCSAPSVRLWPELARRRIEVRYDPEALDELEIHFSRASLSNGLGHSRCNPIADRGNAANRFRGATWRRLVGSSDREATAGGICRADTQAAQRCSKTEAARCERSRSRTLSRKRRAGCYQRGCPPQLSGPLWSVRSRARDSHSRPNT